MNLKLALKEIRRGLGLPIELHAARDSLPEAKRDQACGERLRDFTTDQRRQQWLRGRRALAELLPRIGRPSESPALQLPCRGISLTHGDDLSIAAGLAQPIGIGIDFEAWRQVDVAMLRWYLSRKELAELLVPSHFSRLRLWTVKEALFKACRANRGLRLCDFETDDATVMGGEARCRASRGDRFRYQSVILRRGILSIAIETR